MDAKTWEDLIQTVHRLRAPGGCPWDRAQTHQSLRPYLIEEAYEVLDVLDQIQSPDDLKRESTRLAFREELGDLLMQVLIHSEMASETGAFDSTEVARELNAKLIRRHPHVFGDEKATTADEALLNWEKQKAKEKKESVLAGVPRGMPSLQKAARVIEKVSKVGFQWKDLTGPSDKLEEELGELKHELHAYQAAPSEELKARISSELGDVLFSLCNIAYFLKISPEDSLREMLQRFESRFRYVEECLKDRGKSPEQSSLEEMDKLWNEAKVRPQVIGLTGGIASGKSTVARLLEQAGVAVLDADQISREASAPGGDAHAAIQARFGTADRAALRKLVFVDPQARQDLEAILHPIIRKKSSEQIQKLKAPLVIYEATLLVETGRYRAMDGLIVVQSPKELRLKRLIKRDGITSELAGQIMDSQTSDEARTRAATWLVDNSGNLDALKAEVQKLASRLKGLS